MAVFCAASAVIYVTVFRIISSGISENLPFPKGWTLEMRFLTFLVLSSGDLWYKQHFCKAVSKSDLCC